jgi:hypothetical protein
MTPPAFPRAEPNIRYVIVAESLEFRVHDSRHVLGTKLYVRPIWEPDDGDGHSGVGPHDDAIGQFGNEPIRRHLRC